MYTKDFYWNEFILESRCRLDGRKYDSTKCFYCKEFVTKKKLQSNLFKETELEESQK